jgi:hypothetical protein
MGTNTPWRLWKTEGRMISMYNRPVRAVGERDKMLMTALCNRKASIVSQ